MKKNLLKTLLAVCCCLLAGCQPHLPQDAIVVSDQLMPGSFPLSEAVVVCDTADGKTIGKVTALFAEDIGRVTGNEADVSNTLPQGKPVVLLGTPEGNQWIRQLDNEGKLDASALKGSWERFCVKQVDHPFPGVEKALVIAGSDRRGTAYGAFTLSEKMGVSPFYWWTDVPVTPKSHLYVKADYTSPEPSVRYRGLFINDEDWGLYPWASHNYEKDLGNIGPKTYAKVCELILRLKGNMLAPAMHACSAPFYSHPDNKAVADEYGIFITTSHCEPLLFNNASKLEWDTKKDGDWDYSTNRAAILKKLDDRVREASPYDNIYTLAMRGLHDAGMRGNLTKDEKVAMLQQAITDQRGILQKYITQKPLEDIPQIFVPYKEALDLYERGLSVPEEVILVWPDDNYGYLKRLSDPEEQKRKGGSGVYYHLSYLGAPHDYLWLNTTPPVLMYEELLKAYQTGGNRYWLLNVGDIKPMELGLKTFFELAWDVNRFSYDSIRRHQARYLASLFGEDREQQFQELLDTYYRLAWSRKPEFMGWEREWDRPGLGNLRDTDFSFSAYNDARQRLADYERLSSTAARICEELPEELRPAFFELIGYQAMASCQMNRKFLLAQLNHELTRQGGRTAEANWAATQARAAFDSIATLNTQFNTMLEGKWAHMMALAPGWVAKYQRMPQVDYQEGAGETPVDLSPQEEQNKLDGCTVIDLRKYTAKADETHPVKRVDGIGYDWTVLQLGEATQPSADPTHLNGPRVEFKLPHMEADSVTVHVYTLPFFPLHAGKGANRYGISVDRQPVQVAENLPKEYSKQWKDQVLRNGALHTARFAIDPDKRKHTLTLTCGDPGVMVQRIVVDWGGLKETYVGPSAALAD